jgi:hypothetical protein
MRRGVVCALFALWVTALLGGMALVDRHAAIAANDESALRLWPSGGALARDPRGPTLVCFIHPRCPCSRATLRQLERVVARAPRAATLVVYRADPGVDVQASASWALGGRLPGARRVLDPGGAEARRFGAHTSGLVMLFDAGGAMRFRGGVTPTRGHEGDNEGADALEAALRNPTTSTRLARVFGCGL